jgi:adenylate cyclase
MPSIHVISKEGGIYDYHIFKEEITIGRGKENDIALKDSTISRNHAKITKSGNEYRLIDLGSFNGTLINGKPVQNAILRDKDQIRIGLTKLIFSAKKQSSASYADSQILFSEANGESDDQHIIKSRPLADFKKPEELLIRDIGRKSPSIGNNVEDYISQEGVSTLERSNKVLFVLYEISKQLNAIGDFDELLKKIMDLIFMVIDADYGFLILTGEKSKDNLVPVVVKIKNDKIREKGELRASRTIVNKVIRDKVSLMTSNAMMDSRLDHGKSLFLQQVRSAMCVPLWKKDTIIGVIQLGSVRMDNHFDQDDLQLLQTIGSQMAMVIEQASLNEHIREEERLRNRLERFHSPQVIEMIIKSGQDTKDNIMEPKDLTATILFADIIGFTHLSEKMPPRDINMILNRFFSRMTDIIFEFGGTLDKYIGDALMAVFGAPMEKDGDTERAVQAALKMRRELAAMMDSTAADSRFDIRIGINTGRVVAGNIGSPRRMDYTVIGDPVNIAQRLESIAQPNQILIGQETYNHVRDRFRIEKVGEKHVKGRAKEVIAYEVIG